MSGGNLSQADELAYYNQLPYVATISTYECDGQILYIASHPELYGCVAKGRTPSEALRNLNAVRPTYMAALIEMGVEIPLPIDIAWASPRAGAA